MEQSCNEAVKSILSCVEKYKSLIVEVEQTIWKNPEIGYKEWKTSRYLADIFQSLGYQVTLAGDIPGFAAQIDTGRPGPVIAIVAEEDSIICPEHPEADPATGAVHACGHNAQSAYLVGCAAALAEPGALDGLCGSIRFLSIPAEETIDLEYRSKLIQEGTIHYLAGKIEFLYRGLFDGVQLVLFTHVLSEETSLFAIDKGADLDSRMRNHFGCPMPEGYRKALRLMKQAEKFHRPVICLVDTLGAYCGAEAEERGQGEAIAENILEMMGLRTPVISVVIGEGGSGGALALAAADRVYMLENAVYSVISPEGCASILWKDSGRVADAAQCLHITAADMVDLHVAEGIIPENFADFQQMCAAMTVQLTMDLDELCALTPEELLEQRYRRYRRIGVYEENGSIVRFTEH